MRVVVRILMRLDLSNNDLTATGASYLAKIVMKSKLYYVIIKVFRLPLYDTNPIIIPMQLSELNIVMYSTLF